MEAKSTKEIKLIANSVRHDIIEMLEASKSGHPGGSLSIADILSTLYFSGTMKYDSYDPNSPVRDHLILSKGHAAPALYAIYHQLGWIQDDELVTLRQLNSRLQGHPDCHYLPGLDVCSGSLGQGLSVACGEAISFLEKAKKTGDKPQHLWVITGDGELQEGSNWEAFMFASHKKLYNITVFVDLNNLQIDGHVTDVNSLGDIDAKLKAFGWNVKRISGHDVDQIKDACEWALASDDAPCAIVCETKKGKGVSFMEDECAWHGVAPSAEQAEEAYKELAAERVCIEGE